MVQAVLWPFILLDRATRLLPHKPLDVLLRGALLGVLALGLARLADRDNKPAIVAVEVLLGLPGLLVALAVLGAGLGLAPPVVIGCLVAAAFGVMAGLPGGGLVDPPASGLPRRMTVRVPLLLGAGLAVGAAASVFAAGPGDAQVPIDVVAALEGLMPPAALPWVVGGAMVGAARLLRPPAEEIRAGHPEAAAAVLAALAVGAITAWWAPSGHGTGWGLAAAPLAAGSATVGSAWSAGGLPRPHWRPTRLLLLAIAPLAAAAAGVVHVAATGFLGCEAVVAHPAVTRIDPTPGTFAVQPVPADRGGPPGGAVVVALRDAEEVRWIPLGGGEPVVHDLEALPLLAWDGVVAPMKNAYPEELGLDPTGTVHVWVEVPPPGDMRVRLLIDGATGALEQADELPDTCFVSSWLYDAPRRRAALGCEWEGELMIDGDRGIERTRVAGAGEIEELIVDPSQDHGWLAVSLWSHPWLARIDPDALTVTDRRFIGSFVWGLAADHGAGLVAVPRFVAGQVLLLDAATLSVERSVRAGWGLRPIVKQPGGPWLTASTYDGWLYAIDEAPRPDRLRLGGWVRDLDLLDHDTLIAGGACGVMRVDLDRSSW